MKNTKNQLVSIAAALMRLAAQIEKLASDPEVMATEKRIPTQKAKIAPKKKITNKKVEKIEEKSVDKATDKPPTVLQQVYDVICKSKKGASIDKLKEKTQLDSRQLSNALYKLTKKGIVEARARGIYFKKK